jgi:hypothetical protein
MAAGDIFPWKMAPLIDPMAGGAVINVNVAFQELGKR